ncbi:Beta-N-acetylhexosaminidase [Saliniradius amylolyticus]|uniref:beta-N-acetylhexosaminidase n=1 Tax=Saliniradius amylolyticus TaxID=2183582 RepID=A0A2S2E2V9_9ALTE|nr:family 20 glycosylhydrolase [Saliniradius amylolyticus]AWL11973.1 Beta-N-acetylhexosaminidase [Saliniradius amylolyticus]
MKTIVYTTALIGAMSISGCAPQNEGLSQQQLHRFAQQLDLTFRVNDNLSAKDCSETLGGGQCFSGELVLRSPLPFESNNWAIYFSNTKPIQSDSSDAFDITHINGDLHALTPTKNFTGFEADASLEIPFKGTFWSISQTDATPNYFIVSGELEPEIIQSTQEQVNTSTEEAYLPFVAEFKRPEQYKRSEQDNSPLADAEHLYQYYQNLQASTAAESQPRIIPKPAQSNWTGDTMSLDKGLQLPADFLSSALGKLFSLESLPLSQTGLLVQLNQDDDIAKQGYQLDIGDTIQLRYRDTAGQFYGLITLAGLYDPDSNSLPKGQIQDQPRYDFRGVHLDVARNFHSKTFIEKLLDQMALLKLNKLHLHLADDEGWRLEIPGLPELTDIGGYRCFDLTERRCLQPQLGSGPFKDTSVNGYLSVTEYQQLLQYAAERHIEIIPSLDMPGHSRAAIKSMEVRYQRLMAEGKTEQAQRYRLVEPEDKTVYSSVQYYNDNTLNPCIDSTYRFVEKVLSEVQAMHQAVGVPIQRYHIGADETEGAWVDSPACQALMQQQGINEADKLTGYFIEKVTATVAGMGVTAGAWSDGLSHVDAQKLPEQIHANVWGTLYWDGAKTAHQMANTGWDVVLSIPDVLYFDFPYSAHPDEPGYYWATRSTDSFQVFQFMPDNLPVHAEIWRDRMGNAFRVEDNTPLQDDARAYGIQGQLWSETLRLDSQVSYMLFPRLHALAERAWHKADWELAYTAGQSYGPDTNYFDQAHRQQQLADWQGFAGTLVTGYLPLLTQQELMFRLPPPGAVIEHGVLSIALPWPHLEAEYRTHNGKWQTYKAPVETDTPINVRTRLPGTDKVSRAFFLNNDSK